MNHKHTILTLILLTLSASLLTGQNKQNNKHDYIASGYYQLVYEADIANLEGNDSLAFAKMQKAAERCPIVNILTCNEMELYCRLLMKHGQYEKAISYMNTLANEYGKFPITVLIDIGKDDNLSKNLLKEIPDFYISKMPKLLVDIQWYYFAHDSIINTLIDICRNDQIVRMTTIENESLDFEKMRETDNANYKRLFQLIDKFGFPNMKLYGYANIKVIEEKLYALCMHIADHENIEDTILQFVREGKCDPDLYGMIVDRKILPKSLREKGKPMCLYCPYSNIGDEEILDIENLDERRTTVGMPTRAMQRKRIELLTKLYEQ